MVITHLVMMKFFTGASGSIPPTIDWTLRARDLAWTLKDR